MPRLQPPSSPVQLPSLSMIPKTPAAPAVQVPFLAPAATPAIAPDQVQVSTQGSAMPTVSLVAEPQFIEHTVKRGETLGKIADKYLGNPNQHMLIYKANQDELRNPNDLRIGMTIKVPVPAGSHPSVKPESPATTQPDPALPANFSQHAVKRGETLSSIALDTLGDSERYMEIYQANRDQLKSPDDLQRGMVLKIPQRQSAPTKPTSAPTTAAPTAAPTGTEAIDATGLSQGAQDLLAAMQRYQVHHDKLGNTNRTQTTPAQMREIARELDSASKAFGVDPKMMLALYAHESGGINPGARSHTGAGGLGQLTSIAIRQVHFMAGIGKGNTGTAPYNQHKSNFIQNTRSIRERYDIKANVWTSVAYMTYELNERARLGRGVEKALKRYGDPNVARYADKVNEEHRTLFGSKLF